MLTEVVMFTVRQRAVGNNARLQDGTRISRPTVHVRTILTEVQQEEAGEITFQEAASPAAIVAAFQEVVAASPVEEDLTAAAEAAGEDVDSVDSHFKDEKKIPMMRVNNYNE